MNIGSICRRHVVAIDAAGTLRQAAALMHEHHVGALIVTAPTDEGPRVVGIVTDRDLVIDALARGLEGEEVTIGDLAHDLVATVPETATFGEAIAAMQAAGVRRLPVRNEEGNLCGIVSLDDMLDACATEMAGLARVIRSGIEREAAESAAALAPTPTLRVPAMGTVGWGNLAA